MGNLFGLYVKERKKETEREREGGREGEILYFSMHPPHIFSIVS